VIVTILSDRGTFRTAIAGGVSRFAVVDDREGGTLSCTGLKTAAISGRYNGDPRALKTKGRAAIGEEERVEKFAESSH